MVRIVSCPSCGGESRFAPDNPFRPFCGERCRLTDLGAWADGRYTIPGDAVDDDSIASPPPKMGSSLASE
ncbi:MAG: DNA gyrase inhibitor YacG [Burkholderiales bacterium]|nr:DNA gyrase inhibitor YacG [Burkholderiales bacterium]